MEALDQIANGMPRCVLVSRFYFGENGEGSRLVSDLGDIDAREVNSLPVGNGIVLRVGRYGPYLERGEDRANVPPDLAPDELTVDKAEELLTRPSGDKVLGTDPESGREIVAKSGRFGPYVTEVLRRPRRSRQGSDRVAVQDHDAGCDHAGRRDPAVVAAARARRRAGRRGGDRAERTVRGRT
jgi:DNA topoisomerase-1